MFSSCYLLYKKFVPQARTQQKGECKEHQSFLPPTPEADESIDSEAKASHCPTEYTNEECALQYGSGIVIGHGEQNSTVRQYHNRHGHRCPYTSNEEGGQSLKHISHIYSVITRMMRMKETMKPTFISASVIYQTSHVYERKKGRNVPVHLCHRQCYEKR